MQWLELAALAPELLRASPVLAALQACDSQGCRCVAAPASSKMEIWASVGLAELAHAKHAANTSTNAVLRIYGRVK